MPTHLCRAGCRLHPPDSAGGISTDPGIGVACTIAVFEALPH
jgi:hypothetical protein